MNRVLPAASVPQGPLADNAALASTPQVREAAQPVVMDAIHVQAAAVAAQQAALDEQASRLAERRAALEKQEEQLAAHLESRRLDLLVAAERLQSERAAHEKDRAAFEQQIQAATAEMTAAQRSVEEQAEALRGREQALADKRLRFHTQYELGRCQLRETWQRLRQDQFRWKHRRGKERAALKLRERDLGAAAQQLLQAREAMAREKQAWDTARADLRTELEGLETRVANQRAKMVEEQDAIARLDAQIRAQQAPGPQQLSLPALVTPAAEAPAEHPPSQAEEAWHKRFQDLDCLAGDLADQRLQLVEHWHELAVFEANWDNSRHQASLELEELARRLVDNGRLLAQREETALQADQVLRQRHEELVVVRQQMLAWRARLRVREQAWETERQQLRNDVETREALAARHFEALVELRQRWVERRRDELDRTQAERRDLETARMDNGKRQLLLVSQAAALQVDKRAVVEKTLALEQYRREFLAKTAKPGGERRLERLRRRWITLHAMALRAIGHERESLKAVLSAVEERHAELSRRADELAQAESRFLHKQTAWEHQQTLAVARQARLHHELDNAKAQRQLFEQQAARMKDEIERIARSLIDEPDPPNSEALDRAA
jgi:epidermal growth factor receptor substrate 15